MVSFARLIAERRTEATDQDDLDLMLGVSFDPSTLPMLVIDTALDIVRANPAAGRMLGADVHSLVGRSLPDFCVEDRARQVELLSSAYSKPPSGLTHETDLRAGEGRRVRAELRADPIESPSGRPLMLIQLRDASTASPPLTPTAAAPGFDELCYRQLAASLPTAAVEVFDRDLRYTLVDGEVVRASGLDADALRGRLVGEVVAPALLPIVERPYLDALQGRASDLYYVSPVDGGRFRLRVQPVTDADGAVVGGLSVTEDVTADRARQSALEQAHSLSSLGSCSYSVRSGWTFDAELLGICGLGEACDPEDVLRLVVPEDRAQADAAWALVLGTGGRVSLHYRVRHGRSGELRRLQASLEAVVDGDGALLQAMATFIDVTDTVSTLEVEERAKARAANERTALLRRVSDMMGSGKQGLAQTAQSIADLAVAVIGEGAVLRVLTPDQQHVERDFAAHRDPFRRGRLVTALRRSGTTFSPGTSVYTEVIKRRRLVSDVRDDAQSESVRSLVSAEVAEQVRHCIVAPVRFEGRALGLMTVYRTDPSAPYEPGDHDMVQVLADRVGATLATGRVGETTELERHRVADRLQELTHGQEDLLEQLATTEARERQLLAEAVHDDPLQLIVAAILRVDLLRMRMTQEDDTELDGIATLLENSVDRLRQLIVALAPPDLTEGLTAALGRQAEGIFVGTTTVVQVAGPAQVNLTPDAKATVCKVIREALVNSRKHAGARTVLLRVDDQQDAVVITVTDDGVGSSTLNAGPGHLGLHTMRARALAEGADLSIRSAPGEGTTVVLRMPIFAPTT